MKPILVIPAYNVNSLDELVNRILDYYSEDIIIVDDGSNPCLSLDNLDNNNKITLLTNYKNMGKGYSLKKALSYISSRNYTHAITLDADFQHDPKHLLQFINVDEDIDIIIGMRSFTSEMPIHRRLSNYLTSKIISIRCKRIIYDSQSGYRRYKLSSILDNSYNEDGFQFETEILIKILSKKHHSIDYIPIETIYGSESSSIRNIRDTLKFIKLILRSLFWRIN
ncbi:MAG: glycosyltransferase family 2 protein [Candidatus Marinimicrobia bacterium]|nr:glycosyltransferase family 2 protein [Candidatus Neomarinimicrobiota bacterium]MBL7023030.1 glycosyltransferase family 2 protein [Candidatus Neomarinimicrobiota bacterium]